MRFYLKTILLSNYSYLYLAFLQFASPLQYALYWSGYTPSATFNGQSNDSFLSVWEAGSFSITSTRVPQSNIPPLSNPPGQPGIFDGRLRGVSIYFRYKDIGEENGKSKIVGDGVLAPQVARGSAGHLLPSQKPVCVIKPDSFWAKEESELENSACIDNSKYLPGCLNQPDQQDNSSLTVIFPVGVASRPHGYYSEGIFSELVTKYRGDWDDYPDYTASHQKFVLLLLRKFLCFILFNERTYFQQNLF